MARYRNSATIAPVAARQPAAKLVRKKIAARISELKIADFQFQRRNSISTGLRQMALRHSKTDMRNPLRGQNDGGPHRADGGIKQIAINLFVRRAWFGLGGDRVNSS